MKFDINSFKIQEANPQQTEDRFFSSLKDKEFLDDSGYPRVDKDSDIVLAKSIRNKKSKSMQKGVIGYSYYLKIHSNKNLVDSRTLYKMQESNSSYVDHICKSDKEYIEVSHDTFTKYLNFLKTENIQWLNMAQKDIK